MTLGGGQDYFHRLAAVLRHVDVRAGHAQDLQGDFPVDEIVLRQQQFFARQIGVMFLLLLLSGA